MSNALLKSEIAIGSVVCQTKQPKTFLLQVKKKKKITENWDC